MYQVIVVGTDGSETAGVAVKHATMLAKLSGATLHIVHAHHLVSSTHAAIGATSGMPTVDAGNLNAGIAADSEAVCDHAATEAKRAGVKFETHSRSGDAAASLTSVAGEVGADLLVVGNRGMSGMKRLVLGSVPNKVSHHCPCSLLIVDTSA
jgi:nucleotide-binding universal stress UspA family protein